MEDERGGGAGQGTLALARWLPPWSLPQAEPVESVGGIPALPVSHLLSLLPLPWHALAVQTYKWAQFQHRSAAKVEHILGAEQEQVPALSSEDDPLRAAVPGGGTEEGAGLSGGQRHGEGDKARGSESKGVDPASRESTGAGEIEEFPGRAPGSSRESRRIGIDFSKLKYRKHKVKDVDEATGQCVIRTVLAVDPNSIPRQNAYDQGWLANVWEVLSPLSKRAYRLNPSLEWKTR